jgi:hypothetical protein
MGSVFEVVSCLLFVVVMMSAWSTGGNRAWIARNTSWMLVEDVTGIASVLGNPSPAKEVSRMVIVRSPEGVVDACDGATVDKPGDSVVAAMMPDIRPKCAEVEVGFMFE